MQVDSKQWTAKNFARLLAQKIRGLPEADQQNTETLKKIKSKLISDLIIKEIIAKWARENKISVSKKELKKETEKIINSYPNPELFYFYLKKMNLSKEQWKEQITGAILSGKALKSASLNLSQPKTLEMKAYYEENPALFSQPKKALVRHFFHKQESTAKQVKSRLKKGENFKDLVKKFSQTPKTEQLKWQSLNSSSVLDKAFFLKKGEISPILSSEHGWHIVEKVEEKPALKLKFNEARPYIAKILILKKQKALFKNWLDKQVKKTDIFKDEKALKQIKVKSL